jgi:hypothetical protein
MFDGKFRSYVCPGDVVLVRFLKTSGCVDLFVNGMSDVCIVLSVAFTSSVAGAATGSLLWTVEYRGCRES